MAWEYDGFSGVKVEDGRKLLNENEDYRDSADLQMAVRDKDLTDELWPVWWGPTGSPGGG